MKFIVPFIALLFLTNNCVSGQRSLTKDEIMEYWKAHSGRVGDSSEIVNSDSGLNVYLSKLVDSFQVNNIDSLLIISTAYPGHMRTSKCDTGIFPITTFILWNKNKITHIKKLDGKCSSERTINTPVQLFDFYNEHSQQLQVEFFIPVVLGGQISKDSTTSYSMILIAHEPSYTFYYKIGQDSKSFQFCQSYLDDKRNLFIDHNLSLAAYTWWQLVKNVTDNIE